MTSKQEKENFYITTTLPYVNGKAHIGHALEFIRADVLARHKRLTGADVFFNTGTDEHGQKLFLDAIEKGITPKEYVDIGAKGFRDLTEKLNMSHDNFVRTTEEGHKKAAQEFWKVCDKNGYIYKKDYQTKYCIGCELEKQDSELLEDGTCPDHPGKDLDLVNEENYFFKWSAFSDDLLKYYTEGHIIPDFRTNEIENFVKAGIRDFSISRLKSKLEWGVPVPGDEDHVMYVWFDALSNYISVLGWGSDDEKNGEGNFEKFWQNGTTFQICGKDNLRQQSGYWQGMLFAAGIKNTDVIYINGHATAGGQKMSKSVGNVIDPEVLIDRYGADALRYFCVRHFHNHQDSDFTIEKFHETYMANLVNGIGNLTNRILKMASDNEVVLESESEVNFSESLLEKYDFNGYGDQIWKEIGELDQFITDERPFKKIKEDKKAGEDDIRYLLEKLKEIALKLQPLIPGSAEKILKAIEKNEKPEEPIFPRLEFEK